MRHAGVLVTSSEADIGRVSASELFSQQTCKWIPNGLFTYITLAGAPLQARLHQPIRCPSILLLPDSWCNDSVQRTLHLCWRPAPAQCGAGAAEAAQPPLPGDKRAEHRAKTGTSEEMGKKEDRGYSTFPNCHGHEREALLPLVLIVEC